MKFGGYGFASTMHVWHQGRKVTGLGRSLNRPRWDYYRGGYVYPQMPAPAPAVPTISERSQAVIELRYAHGSFRLVDRRGKACGRRYTRLGPHECGAYLVVDQHGNQDWIDGDARVRPVNQQPEDTHSQASRIINHMHRQLKEIP
jgi:hypothetical protein